MTKIYKWIISDNIWDDFKLDNRLYIAAYEGIYGWRYQFVFWDWYSKYLKNPKHGHIYHWSDVKEGHPSCRFCGFNPDYS